MTANVDRETLTWIVSDSVATLHEISDASQVRPHLKLLLRVGETASLSAKRLALALQEVPRPRKEQTTSTGPTKEEIAAMKLILDGAVCTRCGGEQSPTYPLRAVALS